MSITGFPYTNLYKLKPVNTTPHAAKQRPRYVIVDIGD